MKLNCFKTTLLICVVFLTFLYGCDESKQFEFYEENAGIAFFGSPKLIKDDDMEVWSWSTTAFFKEIQIEDEYQDDFLEQLIEDSWDICPLNDEANELYSTAFGWTYNEPFTEKSNIQNGYYKIVEFDKDRNDDRDTSSDFEIYIYDSDRAVLQILKFNF